MALGRIKRQSILLLPVAFSGATIFAGGPGDRSRMERPVMSFDQTKWIWRNGEIIPWADANTHLSAHALHYGTGVFEGMRCYATDQGPAVFRLEAHLDRLYNSAAVYGL